MKVQDLAVSPEEEQVVDEQKSAISNQRLQRHGKEKGDASNVRRVKRSQSDKPKHSTKSRTKNSKSQSVRHLIPDSDKPSSSSQKHSSERPRRTTAEDMKTSSSKKDASGRPKRTSGQEADKLRKDPGDSSRRYKRTERSGSKPKGESSCERPKRSSERSSEDRSSRARRSPEETSERPKRNGSGKEKDKQKAHSKEKQKVLSKSGRDVKEAPENAKDGGNTMESGDVSQSDDDQSIADSVSTMGNILPSSVVRAMTRHNSLTNVCGGGWDIGKEKHGHPTANASGNQAENPLKSEEHPPKDSATGTRAGGGDDGGEDDADLGRRLSDMMKIGEEKKEPIEDCDASLPSLSSMTYATKQEEQNGVKLVQSQEIGRSRSMRHFIGSLIKEQEEKDFEEEESDREDAEEVSDGTSEGSEEEENMDESGRSSNSGEDFEAVQWNVRGNHVSSEPTWGDFANDPFANNDFGAEPWSASSHSCPEENYLFKESGGFDRGWAAFDNPATEKDIGFVSQSTSASSWMSQEQNGFGPKRKKKKKKKRVPIPAPDSPSLDGRLVDPSQFIKPDPTDVLDPSYYSAPDPAETYDSMASGGTSISQPEPKKDCKRRIMREKKLGRSQKSTLSSRMRSLSKSFRGKKEKAMVVDTGLNEAQFFPDSDGEDGDNFLLS